MELSAVTVDDGSPSWLLVVFIEKPPMEAGKEIGVMAEELGMTGQ